MKNLVKLVNTSLNVVWICNPDNVNIRIFNPLFLRIANAYIQDFRIANPKGLNNFGYNSERDILTIPQYAVFALADNLKRNDTLPNKRHK
ncbi:MAG: hypothetical protein J6W06_05395 [Bacteroidales bacterium]|nr:hypothetical protein [Bacteroidales bacterium]